MTDRDALRIGLLYALRDIDAGPACGECPHLDESWGYMCRLMGAGRHPIECHRIMAAITQTMEEVSNG